MITTNQEVTIVLSTVIASAVKEMLINKVQIRIAESELVDKNELYELLGVLKQL